MIFFVVCSCNQHKHISMDSPSIKDGVQGYTNFENNESFSIYSNYYDSCFIGKIGLQPEQEAGYMVTILDKKKDFFFVRFDYPDIGKNWIKKGEIGLNIRGLASYADQNSIPIHKKPHSKSHIIGFIVKPQEVPILDEKCHWVYIKAIDENSKEIKGWLAPMYQCGDPYTTCN